MSNKFYVETQFFEIDETEKAKQFKKLFPNGIVKKFILAHEGNVLSNVVGFGKRLFHFSRDVIHNIASKIKKGIQIIKGHTIDNIQRNEETLGEIIDVSIENKNGKSYAVGLVGFYDKNKSDFDAISAEMKIEHEDGIVSNIVDVFRFAVGKLSKGDIPAFDEAKEIGVIHCFMSSNQENIDENKNLLTKEKIKMEEREITFSQVKEFIRKHNVFPTQIWSAQELIGIPKNENGEIVFVGGIDDRLNAYVYKSLPDISKYEKQIQELQKEKQELEKIKTEFDKLTHKQKLDEFKSTVLKKADEKKISEKLKKYLAKKLDKYNAQIVDLEKEADEFIKTSSDEIQDLLADSGEPASVKKFPSEGEPSENTKPEFDDQF